jgi:hypothetical protein
MMTTTTLTTAITISSPPLVQGAFADHGQEIVLTPKDASFAPISSGEGNQVKVVVNYAVQDPTVTNDLVKGVMRVYSPDGALLKTSSSPTPFPITESGTATLATTLTDPTIEDVTAKIVFTNPTKTETISNELPVNVNLIKDAALPGESRERAISQVPQESDSQSEEDEPLPEDKLPSTESAIASSGIEEEQQSTKFEDVPVIHESQQGSPAESIPQTKTDQYVSSPVTKLEPERCNDSIDNDGDTLIDLSDADCNLSQIQQLQQPTLQQEPVIVSSPEICDDDLDNDLDSKVDSSDEECGYIASGMSSIPSSKQAQSVAGELIEDGNEDEDKEQGPDEGSEEAGDEDKGNNDENEDEDEDEDEE